MPSHEYLPGPSKAKTKHQKATETRMARLAPVEWSNHWKDSKQSVFLGGGAMSVE